VRDRLGDQQVGLVDLPSQASSTLAEVIAREACHQQLPEKLCGAVK